jgi:hypothetical protein
MDLYYSPVSKYISKVRMERTLQAAAADEPRG